MPPIRAARFLVWVIAIAVFIGLFSFALGRAFDYEQTSRPVSASEMRLPPGYERLEREVAVLLCSHHWSTGGHVRHEIPPAFVACVQHYNQTGVVP